MNANVAGKILGALGSRWTSNSGYAPQPRNFQSALPPLRVPPFDMVRQEPIMRWSIRVIARDGRADALV
jgi:hypothetical protein